MPSGSQVIKEIQVPGSSILGYSTVASDGKTLAVNVKNEAVQLWGMWLLSGLRFRMRVAKEADMSRRGEGR